jgi:predicted MFS family arabinose efflux permease
VTLEPVIRALRFHHSDREYLRELPDREWDKILALTDAAQLTLALGIRCRDVLPQRIRERIDRNIACNAERYSRITSCHREIASAFQSRGVEFVALKGISQCPFYADEPFHRPQYDIDVFCRQEDLVPARDAALALGYEPLAGFEGFPIDHLPNMIRRNGWRWRGDYYDPEMPLSLDIHFRLWDPETEGFDVPGIEEFWSRRGIRETVGGEAPAFGIADGLAYSALHLLRHLLRGDPRPFHAYEIAHFLERTSEHHDFWEAWQDTHPSGLRQVEAIAFRFAAEWFGCRLAPVAQAEIESLPEGVKRWFELFSLSPVRSITRPNKDELLLHLQLIPTSRARRRVAARRILPMRTSAFHLSPHVRVPGGFRQTLARSFFKARFLIGRFVRHANSMAPLLVSGVRWWWGGKQISASLISFLVAATLFNVGQASYFLLYNLHLLRLGFHEDVLGLIASVMSAGSIAGTLPGGMLARRFGLRTALVAAFLLVPAVGVMRAMVVSPSLLAVSAFVSGFGLATYAVCLAPVVAALTTERSRPFAFSLVFAVGIGAGAVAGLVGGRLPALLGTSAASGLRPALLASSALAALAVAAAFRLKIAQGAFPSQARQQALFGLLPSRFLVRFLAAASFWWVATGAFNPFFNSYFATQLNMSVERIGLVFASSQAFQVLAVLIAPAVLKRLGLINGMASMQLATAGALALLAIHASAATVPLLYCSYMALQYMSEPGLYTLLMNSVPPERRSTASSLNLFVMFSVQAVAAALAGFSLRRFGYETVLVLAAILAGLAAVAFRLFLPATGVQGSRRDISPVESAATTTAVQ